MHSHELLRESCRKTTTRDTRSATYSPNTLNQYTSRTVPGYVNVLGTATNTATVSLWSKESTALYTTTTRKGDYFRGEMPFNNSTGAMWLTITNVAALSNYAGADIVTNIVGQSLLAKTSETFGYDADGNLTSDSLWSYTWDAENRLVTQESVSSLPMAAKRRLEFAYDHQSRRIQKLVSTNSGSSYVAQSTNRFVYDGWNLIGVLAPNASLLSSFMWGLDLSGTLQGAGGVGGLLATWNSELGMRNFVAYDGNGNVAVLVNATNGTGSARYEYGPFGEVLRATGPMAKANPFRFSTKYQDDETDQLYYGYRSYNPSVGRWISRDPLGERGGGNLYAFVRNTPIGFIDATGLIRFGDDNWNCRICVCKSVSITYEPGGDFMHLGWYYAGYDWNGDIYKFGNKIHVEWSVIGDRSACRYYQDESRTTVTAVPVSPPGPPQITKGKDGNVVASSYYDYMGAVIPPGTTWLLTVNWDVVFRCVDSKPFSGGVTHRVTKAFLPTPVDANETN